MLLQMYITGSYRKYSIMAADGFIALATLGLAISYWAGFQDKILLLVLVMLVQQY